MSNEGVEFGEMKVRNKNIKKLLEHYKEIAVLNQINATLGYDLNVSLPQKGSEGRAAQSAYVTKILTEKWLDVEFRKLVEDTDDKGLLQEEISILRNLKHLGHYYWQVPKEVIVELSEETSRAFMVWSEAKKGNKFKDFLPNLEKVLGLQKIIAEHLGYKENRYDALLDLYEPGLTTKDFDAIVKILQPELTKLVKAIQKSKKYTSQSELIGGNNYYPVDDQRQVGMFAARKLGYDFDAGRLDVSSHPFTETLGKYDVRITTRYKTSDFRESLMGTIHETGHALYEQGVNEEYENTPLDGGVSLGIHESQSRFWENQVGRSYEFISYMTPVLHAFFNDQLGKTSADTLFRLFNQVNPSFIRTESDEVTYNLHIALRFEIENALINEKIKAEDLTEVWREKMKKYLGVVPETDREGVLQDVHWSIGSFGYFPTYCLGNLYAAQITATMKKELQVEELVAKGDVGTILSWLRSNIHQYGSLYYPKELIKKVTGEPLNPEYFLKYIKEKYKKVYSL